MHFCSQAYSFLCWCLGPAIAPLFYVPHLSPLRLGFWIHYEAPLSCSASAAKHCERPHPVKRTGAVRCPAGSTCCGSALYDIARRSLALKNGV
ncbi:hypothetical protein B0H14DRAFT_2725337 [Mycena olivaceomarginata]|nr:hypothetical protein B0H14DRAFT_2725337 [Mycena olivaceomarginata]